MRSHKALAKRRIRHPLFGLAPVIEGEDASAYEELNVQVFDAIKPMDVIEDLQAADVVELTWEIIRLRRFKNDLLAKALPEELKELIVETHCKRAGAKSIEAEERQEKAANRLVGKWTSGHGDAVRRVDKLMKRSGTTLSSLSAMSWLSNFESIDRIDRSITIKLTLRDAVLREIDRHRISAAQIQRGAIQKIEDAEFETIDDD